VPKKKHTRIVTSKAQSAQLARALSRRQARQTQTELIDHAVPQIHLFDGLMGSWASQDRPLVERGDHELSPFILSLKTTLPSPQELLEETSPSLAINFLRGHQTRVAPSPTPNLVDDLALTARDIESQLTDGLLTAHGWSALSLPLSSHIEIPRLIINTKRPHHEALRYRTHTFVPFSSDAFIPKELPEDIFTYFDFPDDEVHEKVDIVSLDELEEVQEQPNAQRRRIRMRLPSWRLHTLDIGWQRAIASFVGLSFLFVLPLHAMNVVQDLRFAKVELERSGMEAVSLLTSGAQAAIARDVVSAGSDFKAAGEQFQSAKDTITRLGAWTELLLSVMPVAQRSYSSGAALVEVGQELSIAGSRLSDGYAAMEREHTPTPISRLNILEAYLTSTIPHLEAAQQALKHVDIQTVPQAYQETLASLQITLPALLNTAAEFESFYALIKQLLGENGTKRYLIVFQNNTEIRPTGGFIGSFAEVKVHDGVMETLNVPGGGSYDLQGTLQEQLIAPEPLQLLSARWEFQDGNWFPDFPTSARQLMQFYRDAGGPSVDGVLAVNATFVAQLIGLLGPIHMEDYDRTIDEENFIFEAQKIVEHEYDQEENRPKAFIGDLAPLLVEHMIEKTSNDFLGIVDFLNAGLSQKELQLYMEDEALQRQVIKHGWGGEVKWTNQDYLMVVDTNLGGGKTDGVIGQTVDVQINIDTQGAITNTVTIERTHYGIQGLLFTGVNNVDYLRMYVPKGSTLLEATGFSIPDRSLFAVPNADWVIDDDLAYGLLTASMDPVSGTVVSEEHGKTVFGNWVQTKPGTSSTVTFRYRLPFTLESLGNDRTFMANLKSLLGIPETEQYALTIQKQPGILARTTHVQVHVPNGLNPLWSSHDLAATTFTNETDDLFAILFESL
jgi:hypothetical protein